MDSFKRFQKGQVIAWEGDSPENGTMFVLLKGAVELMQNHKKLGEIKIADIRPGGFFGEMSLFLNKPYSATAVAAEDSSMFVVTRLNVNEFFGKQQDATFSLIRTLCAKLDNLAKNETRTEAKNEIQTGIQTEIKSEEKAAGKANQLPSKMPVQTPADKPASEGGGAKGPEVKSAEVKPSNQEVKKQEDSGLFPQGHKSYDLFYTPEDEKLIYEKKFKCRMCEEEFVAPTMRSSAKVHIMEKDFRMRHVGADSLYYRIITCPSCMYSSLADSFSDNVMTSKYDAMVAEISKYKSLMDEPINFVKKADNLFASMYLALKCASICRIRSEMNVARTWMIINWLYSDCGDKEMEQYAAKHALDAYVHAYETTDIPDEQIQQLLLMIGELYFKLNDRSNAQRFWHMAKMFRPGKPGLTQQADDRLNDLKSF